MSTNTEELVFTNIFKNKIASREVQIGLWSNLANSVSTEILSYAGFDWILFDTEHAPNHIASLIPQLQAMKGSATVPIVRPVWNDPIEIKRLLDIGFHNFIVPFVQNAEEAKQAVASVKYPPEGKRGVSVGARGSCYGYTPQYWQKINDHIGMVVQIETLEAAANIESILHVEGVDAVFVGPSDLAASMGHLADSDHIEVQKKIAEIAVKCAKLNYGVGILAKDGLDCRRYLNMGYTFVGAGSDSGILKKYSRELAQLNK